MILFTHNPLSFHTQRKSSIEGRNPASDPISSSRPRNVERSFGSRTLAVLLPALLLLAVIAPDAVAATDVGKNVGSLLKQYAGEMYGGIVAAFSLVFLWNRRYVELATFLFAAIVVAWMVFAPEEIGKAAESIGKQIFG